VTEKVIRKALCPTLVVPPRAPDVPPDAPVQFKRVVCAVDFSDSSLSAVDYALSLAEEADAHLTLLHAIEMPPEFRENPVRRMLYGAGQRHQAAFNLDANGSGHGGTVVESCPRRRKHRSVASNDACLCSSSHSHLRPFA
jgi:nucleotide-binding universal stress UspA family protein